jgi:hypothetical protein
MNTIKSLNKIKGFGIALSLAFGLLFLSNINVQAQYSRDDGWGNDRRERRDARRETRQNRVVVVTNNSRIYRDGDFYERGGYGTIAQIARLNGYQDGLREGADDARDGDRFDPYDEGAYKEGDGGYKRSYGNKKAYEQIYRQGFMRGYQEAFDRYFGGNFRRN